LNAIGVTDAQLHDPGALDAAPAAPSAVLPRSIVLA